MAVRAHVKSRGRGDFVKSYDCATSFVLFKKKVKLYNYLIRGAMVYKLANLSYLLLPTFFIAFTGESDKAKFIL